VRLEAVRSTVTFQSWWCITHKVTRIITLCQVKVTLYHLGLRMRGRKSTTQVCRNQLSVLLTCRPQAVVRDTRLKPGCACISVWL
jgi:hypothetical protein